MRSVRFAGSSATFVLALALASPGVAQTAPAPTVDTQPPASGPPAGSATSTVDQRASARAPSAQLGEIIITATRRETRLQRTPVAVSAIDQNLIRQASPDNIGKLALYVPNFSAETITGFNAASFAMRGVGQNNIIVYFEPPVVVLVDDFVMPSVQTQLLDTFDVSQVEVLRGPQGTLFGKNSSGGAVTVRTKRPELGRLFADARLTYGSFGTREVKGAVNVPLGRIAALRVVGGYEKSNGYYKNQSCYGPVRNFTTTPSIFDGVKGCLHDGRVGGKDVFSGRVKLLVQPTSNITALFQYEMLRDRSDTVPSVNENQTYPGTVPFLTDLLGIKAPNLSSDPLNNSGITLRNDHFQRDIQRINVHGLYSNIDIDVGVGTISSVTGWRKQDSRLPNSYAGVTAVAPDGERLSVFDASRDDNRKTFQQELRFASDFRGPIDFVAGAFYQHDSVDFCVSQLLGFLDLAAGPLPFGRWNDTPFILCNAQKAKSSAIFAEGNYKITNRLTLTAGIRQTWDDKTWRGRQQVFIPQLTGGFDPAITISQPLDASVYKYPAGVIELKDKSKKLTYRLSLSYQATDNIFLYATHATGYKGGGFNDQIGGFAPFGADLNAFREAARATKPETASSYEVGIKSDLADHRIRANVTGFYVKYKDLQKQLNVPLVVNGQPNQVTIFVNAAAATVKGVEAELTAKPVDNLTLRGILGYQDAKYDQYTAPNAGYDLATSPLDRAPKWQWTLAANYVVPLGGYKLTFDGSVAHQSKNLFTQSITDPQGNTFLNARTLVNASITLADVADRYYLRLIGQNLTDKRYRTASQNVAGLWLNSQYGPPRYFGVEAGLHLAAARALPPPPPPPAAAAASADPDMPRWIGDPGGGNLPATATATAASATGGAGARAIRTSKAASVNLRRRSRARLAATALALVLSACGQKTAGGGQAGEMVKSTDEFQARSGTPIDPEHHPGKALFEEHCAMCHNGSVYKAPNQVWLEMMAPDAVLAAMNGGLMARQASALTPQQRVQVAEYLARISLADYHPPAPPPRCSSPSLTGGPPPALVGWGHDNRRFVPGVVAGLTKADIPRLKLKWAFAYPGAIRARSQPTIGWGTVFVGGHDGTIYAFDLASGCLRWSSRVSAEVRTAIVADPASKRLYFGDILGRAYALDAMTGRQLWQRKVDDHPNATITGTPTLAAGTLFVPVSSLEVTSAADPSYACCTFRGKVIALSLADGTEKWRAYTVTQEPRAQGRTKGGTNIMGPSGAPVWNAPTYDPKRNLLYFGSGENYSSPADGNSDAVIAVDARTGKRKWVAQFTRGDAWNVGCMMANENCPREHGPDLDVAASPLLIPLGASRDILVAGQKSGVAFGIDPDTGKVLWQRRLGHGGTQGGVHFGMAAEGTRVFVPINDMADTHDGRKYDARLRGAGLHAIDAATGRVLWSDKAPDDCRGRQSCDPGISAAVTAIPGVVFAGHLDGQFRAYDSDSGKVIWAVDTTRPVKTLTGVQAHGGGMSGPGAAVAQGYVVTNSGYGLYYHMPGNVLLVFAAR